MSDNEAVFTMKLEPELRDSFMDAADRPASQVVRELMRDDIERQQQYRAYLDRKVELARAQRDAGQYVTNEDMEAQAATRREA